LVKIAAVVDSTCLIGLERIGRLDVLPSLLEPIHAPPAVIAEFGSRPDWLTLTPPANRGTIAVLELIVDAGEAEAIALGYELKCRIILDDRKARIAARRLGVQITGTVGLLVKAKRDGIIPALLPLLDALDASHFHVSRALRAEALRLAGE
jgi:predicted nucleic acid-binding protein